MQLTRLNYAMLACGLFVASALSIVSGSAIKGHSQQQITKEAQATKSAAQGPPESKAVVRNAAVPAVLESSKKVYNDESIRRLSQAQLEAQPASKSDAVVKPVLVAAPVAPVVKPAAAAESAPAAVAEAPVVTKKEAVVAAPVVPVKAVEAPAVVLQAAPVSPIVAVEKAEVAKEIVKVESAPSPVVVPPGVPSGVVKPTPVGADELPPQSDRSAPIKEQQAASPPVVESAVVKKVEEVPVVVPVAGNQQQAPIASQSIVQQPSVVAEQSLSGKKDELEHIETPEPDPQLVLSQPIDSATKLLIDLDEHVQKFLPAEDKQEALDKAHKEASLVAGIDYSPPAPVPQASAEQPTGKSSALQPYSSVASAGVVDEHGIVPPPPAAIDAVEKASGGSPGATASAVVGNGIIAQSSASRQGGQNQNQQQVITQLLEQLDALQARIQDTINQLVARRRYVMSALLRPMGTYVRRVRTNLERLQTRVNQLQAAASSVGGGQNRPGGFVDAAAIETIRRRIDDISKRISDIVNRIRFSLTPTSAPLNNGRRK